MKKRRKLTEKEVIPNMLVVHQSKAVIKKFMAHKWN